MNTYNEPVILVSKTYDTVTPESAEIGDYAESGFVYEDEPFSFSGLVSEIEEGGFHQDGSTDWLSSYPVTDYRTAEETTEALHFSRKNPERMRKWFWLAARVATGRS